MSIYQEKPFTPTYLYIKQHSITGLLYFGKTVKNPEKYLGSGKYWTKHLKIHNKQYIETLWYCLFYDAESISNYALMCSKQWDIVNAKDEFNNKIWANLIPENGIDGGYSMTGKKHNNETLKKMRESSLGEKNHNYDKSPTEETLNKMRGPRPNRDYSYNTGEDNYWFGVGPMKGKHHTAETRLKIARFGENNHNYGKPGTKLGYITSDETKQLQRISKLGIKQELIQCPHCLKIGGVSGMKHYHFDKCKLKYHNP